MRRLLRYSMPLALCVLLAQPSAAPGNDAAENKHDAGETERQQPNEAPQLNAEQRRAVGIAVAHPIAASVPERIDALGLVLDPTELVAELGEATAAAAEERSASSELTRLQGLYRGGAGASLKLLEAAQADQAKLQAQAHSASARLALDWGPIATLPQAARQKLADAATSGRSLLVRADLPGRHSIGTVPRDALLDVDGIQVPGHVLGVLRETTELQGVGLLLELPDAPAGLGPGARIPVTLLTAARRGLLLPRDAVLYEESGAYVYKQLVGKADGDRTRYVPVKVTLLASYGDGWLLEGVDDDDDIVVHGSGVLWSLQGMGAHAVDEDED